MEFNRDQKDIDSFQITDYLNDAVILVCKITKQIIYLNYKCEEILRVSKKTYFRKDIKLLFHDSSIIFDYLSRSYNVLGTFSYKEIYVKSISDFIKFDIDIINNQENDFIIIVLKTNKDNKHNIHESNFNLLTLDEIIDKIVNKIKNPLSSIKGSAQLLKNYNSNSISNNNELLNIITTEVDKVTNFVRVFENEQKSLSLVEKEHNIHEIIRFSLGKIDNIIKKNIEIIENFDPSLPNITLDKAKFIDVFYNIIVNAIEAINIENGYVKISTSFKHGKTRRMPHIKKKVFQNYIKVEIEDNGLGIEKENEEKIFFPFYSTKDNKNGFGLYLAKKITIDHGCDLEFKTKNKISIFTIRIPV